MKAPLKILLLEDSSTDAEIIQRLLRKEIPGCEIRLATDKDSFVQAVADYPADIVLSDNSLPQFTASEAIRIVREQFPLVPFILITGTVSEEFATTVMREGADDYILKDRLTRLPASIDSALRLRKMETERQQAALQLRRNEENYRTMMARVSDAFIALNVEWRFTYVNKQAGEVMQRQPGELIGKVIWDEFPDAVSMSFFKCYHQAMEEQTYLHIEEYYPPLGVWLELHIYPSPNGLSIFFRDISERKDAERLLIENLAEKQALAERMSTILNTLPANIALLDEKGTIIEHNDAWRLCTQQAGFIGCGSAIGADYFSSVSDHCGGEKVDLNLIITGLANVLNKKIDEFEYEYSCRVGEMQNWYRMVATPLQDKAAAGAVVMHIDISELRRLEQERLNNKLDEQTRITTAMFRGQEKERNAIGMELHDNVNQILVGTNLMLSMGKKSAEMAQEMIKVAMVNLNNAINENRKIAHVFVAPDLESISLIDQLKKLVRDMLEPAGVTTTVTANEFTEELLDAEKKINIYRIAQEQCTNIVKYAAASKVSVSLSTANKQFRMVISDNGKGMQSDATQTGIGMKNISGRLSTFKGSAKIITAKGEGFVLDVTMPLTGIKTAQF